jgi:hypothetical protein
MKANANKGKTSATATQGRAKASAHRSDDVRCAVNVVALATTLVVNALAVLMPLNGKDTAQIAHQFPVYFLPADYVFSIWGLIYASLIAFAIYQALPSHRYDPRLRRVGYLFALSCVANSAWIFLWHYELFVLTLAVMLALLALLIAIYLRLDINYADGRVPAVQRLTVDLPFSLYLGWISVATIANAADVLYYLRWDGWGLSAEVWTVVMLAAGALLAVVLGATRADVVYMLVVVWAFVGILVNQKDVPVVAVAAGVMAGLVALVALALTWALLRTRGRRRLGLAV